MRTFWRAQGTLPTAPPFILSNESSLFSFLFPGIDYQQKIRTGWKPILTYSYFVYTANILHGSYSGLIVFQPQANFAESLFIRRRYRCKTVILQPSKRCYLYFPIWGIYLFFSIICIGVQLIDRVVLFMVLDACIPTLAYSWCWQIPRWHISEFVCLFFFLPLSHHNQDSIIR